MTFHRVTAALLLALCAGGGSSADAVRAAGMMLAAPDALQRADVGAAHALARAGSTALAVPPRRALAQAASDGSGREPVSGFVRVANSSARFELNGAPFYVTGANQYALMMTGTWDWDGVEAALDEAASLGLNVIRTWAFGERPANGNPKTPALQTAAGVYDEATFKSLDRVVFEAGKRGLRVLLALSNNWDAYGGAPAYMTWAAAAGESIASPPAPDASPFFTSPFCKAAYKSFVATLLNRVNTYSNIAYKDDPAIFGFDLMNEPRVSADPSGDTLHAWMTEMAAHVKSIDSNHLLTTGAEGFFGASTPARQGNNPPGDNGTGNDFSRHHSIKDIDFSTIHVWPDQWLSCCTVECLLPFLRRWLESHIEASGELRKPLLVEEFGAKMRCSRGNGSSSQDGGSSSQEPGAMSGARRLLSAARKAVGKPAAQLPSPAATPPLLPPPAATPALPPPPSPPGAPPALLLRNELYLLIYQSGHNAAAAGQAFGGSLFWLLGIDGTPDSDRYTIYVKQDTATVHVIAEHVSSMRLLDSKPVATPVAEG